MDKTAAGVAANNVRERFPRDQQLDDSLDIVDDQICSKPRSGRRGPAQTPPILPGQPTLSLEDAKELENYIVNDFATPRLDQMAPHLWLVATPSHSTISPIHEQLVRNRRVLVTENPELHLVWHDDRVFIKPIPRYLLSHAFWRKYLESSLTSPFQPVSSDLIQPAVLGFLRSWTYLVRHESDFILAQNSHLIPHGVQYARFMRFIANFKHHDIKDQEVSPRYRFGQLRLTRLNFWSKFFLGESSFYQTHWQHWQYFQRFYGPLLFIFAVFTVILGAMQVGLTAPDIWPAFVHVSVWFSVVTLLIIALVTLTLVALFLGTWLKELMFATRAILRRKKS